MKKVYCIGDCLTAGIGAKDNFSYPLYLQEILGEKYEIINNGKTMLKMESLLKFPDLFSYKDIKKLDIACVWCGTNDLFFNVPPEKVFENYKSYCQLLIDKGAKIIAITFLPRSNKAPEDFEKNRQIFNTLIRENYMNVADVAINEKIGILGCENNYIYYNQDDTTHPNNTGYKVVAEIVSDAVLRL